MEINGKYHYNNEYLFKDLEEKKLFSYIDIENKESSCDFSPLDDFDFKNRNKFEYLSLKGYKILLVDSWLLHLEVEGKTESKEIENLIKKISNLLINGPTCFQT